MPSHLLNPYSSDHCNSSEDTEEFDLDDINFESRGLTTDSYVHRYNSFWSRIFWRQVPLRWRRLLSRQPGWHGPNQPSVRSCKVCGCRFRLLFHCLLGGLLTLICVTAIFRPSYSNPPKHYGILRKRILASSGNGRGNVDNQSVFIAASIYDKDGHLSNGAWGQNVLGLVDLLGATNVFLSIYENNSGPEAEAALERFKERVQCNNSLVYEEHPSDEGIPRIMLPDGSIRIKRMAYLAEVRNRVLRPLEKPSQVTYDKILFLNDVFFDPVDAVQLLFSTNWGEDGEASYKAACAVDFINPFKYYDTFATRDIEGFSMGVPFFPWFPNAGKGFSRQDVLDGKDAVRVKSCWGGMVAFDARFFQAPPKPSGGSSISGDVDRASNRTQSVSKPIRFRAVPDLDWDASECCLIHADILGTSADGKAEDESGIYQNPYVRVAYGPRTLWWLPITRRIERFYIVPHTLINRLVGLPWHNPRRVETRGNASHHSTEGFRSSKTAQNVSAGGDGYCGVRTLQLIREATREGEKNWESVPIPSA